jgi:hypothetical protein
MHANQNAFHRLPPSSHEHAIVDRPDPDERSGGQLMLRTKSQQEKAVIGGCGNTGAAR